MDDINLTMEEDILSDIIDSGFLSEDEIDTLLGMEIPEDKKVKDHDASYRLFRVLYYGGLAEILGLDNISMEPIEDRNFGDKIAIVKFSVAKSVDIDQSVVDALNKTGAALNDAYKEYKELFPADLTVEYLNNRDNQIEIWKRLCVYTVDLKSDWSIQYMEDDLMGDMREVYKWLCKESDKVVTKEDSIKSYKKFAKNISDSFKTCAKKLKEEEEFKEV